MYQLKCEFEEFNSPNPEGKARGRGLLSIDNSESCHGLTILHHSYHFEKCERPNKKKRILLF